MLKRVQDQVLQPGNIIQAFAASGMCPLDFTASYAYKQVPPPNMITTVEEEWIDSDFGEDEMEAESIHSSGLVTLTTLTTSQSAPEHQCSSHSIYVPHPDLSLILGPTPVHPLQTPRAVRFTPSISKKSIIEIGRAHV